MLFWGFAAALTIVAMLAVLWPLLRARPAAPASRERHDVEVYSAQLEELSGDLARGTLRREEAEVARAEVGRRLLRAAQAAEAGAPGGTETGRRRRFVVAVAVVVLLPLTAMGLYGRYGAPGTPDLPLQSRANEAPAADVAELVARAEARLAVDPEDGLGWEVLAPIYLRLGRNEEAARAFGNAARLLGSTASREAGLGEALTRQAGGEISDPAAEAFRRALAADPAYLPARFFLALDLSQEGRSVEALSAWRELIAASPANAPWLPMAEAAATAEEERLAAAAGGTKPGAQRGPNASDMAAAANLQPEEREAMVEGMVAQLAARLQSNPGDVEGWKRLLRSYRVLGRTAEAETALNSALSAFPEDSGERREIAAFAAELGLSGEVGTQ